MRRLPFAFLFFSALVSAHAEPQTIMVTHKGSQSPYQGPVENFTGSVHVNPLFPATEPSRVSGALVTFEPGARAAWHTHPLGQVLIVTSGTGLVQQWGGAAQEIREGDVVRIPPGQKHWHGATATTRMAHVAIQEQQAGKNVDWMEKVTEEQYNMAQTTTSKQSAGAARAQTTDDLKNVSPALAKFAQDRLYGDVWQRPGLSARDRSVITIAAQIARNQSAALPESLEQAIENGVKASEISEVITHLAFYSGWANAAGAVSAAKDVFAQRGIGPDQLPPAIERLLPLNEEVEKQRASGVEANFGAVAPGVVKYTTEVLFRDLWLRPGLAARDRSLVTVSALVASGQIAQIPYHLGRAMDNGLTQEQASEALTQLAFYVGWPNVFSALPVFKEVFEKRSH
jgi:4-carboxymuconolactone decarboxylase